MINESSQIPRNSDPLDNRGRWLQSALSWFGFCIALLCLIVVLGHYVLSVFQAVRWPTKVYFITALLLAFCSPKWALSILIVSLPLLPNLHIQAGHLLHPKVSYFVAYPGFDAVAGFCVGQWLRLYILDKQKLSKIFSPPPWPVGLLLITLTLSSALAIARNLSQSAEYFSLSSFVYTLLRFKLISRLNDYYPVVDLMCYSLAGLLMCGLIRTFRASQNITDEVFRPVMLGLIINAFWGFIQAFTSFGLPPNTLEYRQEIFGFGAQGFQPDTHAFASHMMAGTIGLIGYFFSKNSRVPPLLAISIVLWCLFGIVLSKSRISLLLSIAVLTWLICWLGVHRARLRQHLLPLFFVTAIVVFVMLFVTNNLSWLKDWLLQIKAADFSDVEVLNAISRDRFELHGAAIRMWLDYPFFGVGQGNFFRLSSIKEFSGSHIMYLAGRNLGGENAHNYFLQTLAEVGALGIATFILAMLWPFKAVKNFSSLYPASAMIFALFCGNIYSHPLLIRENMFFLIIFISMLYAQKLNLVTDRVDNENVNSFHKMEKTKWIIISCLIIVVGYYVWQEIGSSFDRLPFEYGRLKGKPIN